MGTLRVTTRMKGPLCAISALSLILTTHLALAKPWYQGDGLPSCAPGKCPKTAEISPIKCSSDLSMYFNNGYPTLCAEGEECDPAEADAANGNPCRLSRRKGSRGQFA